MANNFFKSFLRILRNVFVEVYIVWRGPPLIGINISIYFEKNFRSTRKTLGSLPLIRSALAPSSQKLSAKSHGKVGIFLVLLLAVCLFATLSDPFDDLWPCVTFLDELMALKMIHSRNISPEHALALDRHTLACRIAWELVRSSLLP